MIANLLAHIYPDIDLDGVLQDDGNGIVYIANWNDSRPQPTQAELDAAVIPAKRAKLTTDIDEITATKIAGLFGKTPRSIELIVKQQNYQARVTELIEKEAVGLKRLTVLQDIEINGGALTSVEQTEKTNLLAGILTAPELAEKLAIQAIFTMIKSIRSYGAQLQTNLVTADPDTFDTNTGWPI